MEPITKKHSQVFKKNGDFKSGYYRLAGQLYKQAPRGYYQFEKRWNPRMKCNEAVRVFVCTHSDKVPINIMEG